VTDVHYIIIPLSVRKGLTIGVLKNHESPFHSRFVIIHDYSRFMQFLRVRSRHTARGVRVTRVSHVRGF